MTMMEIIKGRRSVRTFDGKPLNEEVASKIMDYAKNAANPYDIPITWKLLKTEEYNLGSPVIAGEDTYIAGKLKPAQFAEEAFGYSFEDIILYAWSLGIGTTMIGGTMDRKAFEKAAGVQDDEIMPCISPLGVPARNMSIKEGLMRKGIKADTRMDFESIFFDGSFANPLSKEAAGDLSDVFEMVRLAPSAVNKQPWRLVKCGNAVHFYEKRSKGFVSADGRDMQKIDMGIALCHFRKGLEEKGLDADFVIEEPKVDGLSDEIYIASYLIKNKQD